MKCPFCQSHIRSEDVKVDHVLFPEQCDLFVQVRCNYCRMIFERGLALKIEYHSDLSFTLLKKGGN